MFENIRFSSILEKKRKVKIFLAWFSDHCHFQTLSGEQQKRHTQNSSLMRCSIYHPDAQNSLSVRCLTDTQMSSLMSYQSWWDADFLLKKHHPDTLRWRGTITQSSLSISYQLYGHLESFIAEISSFSSSEVFTDDVLSWDSEFFFDHESSWQLT